MKILCTICARGKSKGLKNKNIKKIKDKSLSLYSIEQARKSKIFDKIIFSTDSKSILNLVKHKVDYAIKRPSRLASDKAAKIPAIQHALLESEKYFEKQFDVIMDLDVTSPLRSIRDIKNSCKKFLKNKNSNLFSVNAAKKNPYYNMVKIINNVPQLVIKSKKIFDSRQVAPKIYEVNSSIYIWTRKSLLNLQLFNDKTGVYEMPTKRSIDIDSRFDFDLVKYLIKNKKNEK